MFEPIRQVFRRRRRSPGGWMPLVWAAWLLASLCPGRGQTALSGNGRPVRIALMDFACDDFSYQSAEQAKIFTALLASSMPPVPGVEWIERTQLEPLLSELEHSVAGMVSRDTAARAGAWAGADLALRGGFSTNQAGNRTLQLQLVDLVHAQIFAATNVSLHFGPDPRLKAASDPVAKTAALLAEWLPAQQSRWRAQQDKIFVAVISPDPFPQVLEELKQKAAAGDIVLVIPQQARVAIEEADLGLLGLSEVSGNAWRRFADFYLWQGPPATQTTNRTGTAAAVLQVWDGRTAPVVLPANGASAALSALVASRRAELLAHRADAATGEGWRRPVSDSIAGPLEKQPELGSLWADDPPRTEAHWNALVYRFETAAFVDPGNARVREAWLRVRWHPSLQDRAVSRQRFRRLRSDAWARQVERFGTNTFFAAAKEPVGYDAVLSTLYALDSYSDRVYDGVPPDMPASVEVGWRKELKERLAKQILLFAGEPALAPLRTSLLFTLAYEGPSDPVVRAQALERLLKDVVRDPAGSSFTRWDPPAKEGLARTFADAGRAADGRLWLSKVDAAVARTQEAAKAQKPAPQSALRVPLPRVSALYSLACQPVFDSGELELTAPQVSASPVKVRVQHGASVTRIRQLVAGRQAVWMIGEISTSTPRPTEMSSGDVALRGAEHQEPRLWRIDPDTGEAKLWTNGIANGEAASAMAATNQAWLGLQELRARWRGAAELLNAQQLKPPPVSDGHGGFWAGTDGELVWFDGAGSNVWRIKFERPTTVRRDRFWGNQNLNFGASLPDEIRPEELEAMRTQWARRGRGALLASHLPGEVTALAADGDWLWLATAAGWDRPGAGSRLSLLHMPTRRWVASLPLEWPVSSMAITTNAVWLGLEGPRGADVSASVVRVDKTPWLAVPSDKWLSAEPTRKEVVLAEQKLTPRQRAVRAMFRGESQLLLNESAGQDPVLLEPETLFLLAHAYDPVGLNQPEQMAKFETILLREYPESAFGRWVRDEQRRAQMGDALARRTPPTSSDLDRRVDELFERYDANHDGELSADEVEVLMQTEPDQLGPQVFMGRSVPPRQVMFMARFRHHAGAGVNKQELRAALLIAPRAAQPRRSAPSSR